MEEIQFIRNPTDGYYDGSDGNTYTAITRGKKNPRIVGYLQVFYCEFTQDHYSVPGASRYIPA